MRMRTHHRPRKKRETEKKCCMVCSSRSLLGADQAGLAETGEEEKTRNEADHVGRGGPIDPGVPLPLSPSGHKNQIPSITVTARHHNPFQLQATMHKCSTISRSFAPPLPKRISV